MPDDSNVADIKESHKKKCCKGDVLYTDENGFDEPKDNTCYPMVVVGNSAPLLIVSDVCFIEASNPDVQILANGIYRITEAKTELLRVESPLGNVLIGNIATNPDCDC